MRMQKNDEFNSYVFKPMLHIPPNHLAFMHLKNLTIIAKPNLIRKNYWNLHIEYSLDENKHETYPKDYFYNQILSFNQIMTSSTTLPSNICWISGYK